VLSLYTWDYKKGRENKRREPILLQHVSGQEVRQNSLSLSARQGAFRCKMPAYIKAPRYRIIFFSFIALLLFVSNQFQRIRCEKWLLAFCCALAGVSIWQLMVLQGEVATAKQRVIQAAQQQVMEYLTSNLPQRTLILSFYKDLLFSLNKRKLNIFYTSQIC